MFQICCITSVVSTAVLPLPIVYWTYLCVFSVSSVSLSPLVPSLVVHVPISCATRYLPLALNTFEVLRAADVCTHYLSVYTTSPFLSPALFFLVFSSPVPWLDLFDFFSTLSFFFLCYLLPVAWLSIAAAVWSLVFTLATTPIGPHTRSRRQCTSI